MKITLAKMSQNILYCIYIHKYHLIFLRFYIKSSKTEQRKNTTKTRAFNENSKNSFINLTKRFWINPRLTTPSRPGSVNHIHYSHPNWGNPI